MNIAAYQRQNKPTREEHGLDNTRISSFANKRSMYALVSIRETALKTLVTNQHNETDNQ